ncbi:MAG: hypothetical protein COZ29_01915 [Candidatus Moranbacteria bacterium CG_4_10_14_3_um_filter_45_9]|nr:MAG: hypothetical protein COZ29_01915 [Candidatus Moranbacteria bacterium CG_4_10_14_3_um_filter_45_9]
MISFCYFVMTPDTFKKIVKAVVEMKRPHLSSFDESRLNEIARNYSVECTDMDATIEGLEAIYKENNDIDRKDFAKMRERLERN